MATPVLTAQQRKKALSGKKVSQKVSRKLPLRYENYWPMLTDGDKGLVDVLESVLGPLKTEKKTIPFREVRKMSRDERKERRRGLQQDIHPERKWLVVGVNAVTRGLEKDTVCCVLLGGDVEPKDMIRHVVVKCAKNKVPLLLVPSLRKVTSSSLGHSTIALGLKKSADVEGHYFSGLYQKIKELSSKFSVDEPAFLTAQEQSSDEDEEEVLSKPANQPEPSVYLYRTSTKERVFIPGLVAGQKLSTEEDFLSLNPSVAEPDSDETVPAGISYTLRKPKVKIGLKLKQ